MQKPAPVVWNPACLVELPHASVDVRYACLASFQRWAFTEVPHRGNLNLARTASTFQDVFLTGRNGEFLISVPESRLLGHFH